MRWKRARAGLGGELYAHLLDQRDACVAEGMDEEAAIAESLRQMGDPVDVGTQLDRVHRPKPQWGALALVGLLLLIGCALSVSLRRVAAADPMLSAPAYYEQRWIIYALVGSAVLLLAYFWDYTSLGRRPLVFFGGGTAALCWLWTHSLLFNGARYQAKYYILFAPVLMALLLYGLRSKKWLGFVACLGASAAFVLAALCIPSVACALLVGMTCVLLTLVALWRGWLGLSQKQAAGLTCGWGAAALALFLLIGARCGDYFRHRIYAVLHPETDPLGRGYLPTVIRALLRGAKWTGEGDLGEVARALGQSTSAVETLLPEIPSDFMLTWVIYRFGLLAGLALVGLLTALIVWMFRKALRQQGMLGCLLSLSAACVLGIQLVLYTAQNLGLSLFGALSLPLLSYGRYTVVNLALIGLALSVFREERLPGQNGLSVRRAGNAEKALIFWRDGDLVIGLSRLRKQ